MGSFLNYATLAVLLFFVQHELREVLAHMDSSCALTRTQVHNTELIRTHSDFVCFTNVMSYTNTTTPALGNVVIGFKGISTFLFTLEWGCRICTGCMIFSGIMSFTLLVAIILESVD